jgi:hypothetical protein
MTLKPVRSISAFLIVTFFAQLSIAGQLAVSAIRTAPQGQAQMLPGLKNLPLILDTKNMKAEKLKNVRLEQFNVDKAYGPGSSGGGGICAFGITAGSDFILDNLQAIPFKTQKQRDQFVRKIGSVRFLQGANLEVRGQSVNALNYPSASVIVLDNKACDHLEAGKVAGYSFLLHEYLGVAGIDDTTYQISNSFTEKTQKDLKVGWCENDTCMKRWDRLKKLRLNLAQLENEIAFWDTDHLGSVDDSENSDSSSNDSLIQKEFARENFVEQAAKEIKALKASIKENEAIQSGIDGQGNDGYYAWERAAHARIKLARIYRGEIAKLLAEIANVSKGQ